MAEVKKLFRSNKNKVFAGVCGGIGEHLKVDPVIIRLIWVAVTLFTGIILGIIAYIIAWLVIPKRR